MTAQIIADLNMLTIADLKQALFVLNMPGVRKRKLDYIEALRGAMGPCSLCLAQKIQPLAKTHDLGAVSRWCDTMQRLRTHVCGTQRVISDPNPFYVNVAVLASMELPRQPQLPTERSVEFVVSPSVLDMLRKPDGEAALAVVRCYPSGSNLHRWPLTCSLTLNGVRVPDVLRPKKRDELHWDKPADVTRALRVGRNLLSVFVLDPSASFSLYVQLVQPNSPDALALAVQQQRSVPPEQSRATLVKWFHRTDDDVASEGLFLPLTCPLTRRRLQVPARAAGCTHLQCFDLLGYLSYVKQSLKWLCPVCDKGAPYRDLLVDQYMERVLADPSAAAPVERVEVLPSGAWRPVVAGAKRAVQGITVQPVDLTSETDSDTEAGPQRRRISREAYFDALDGVDTGALLNIIDEVESLHSNPELLAQVLNEPVRMPPSPPRSRAPASTAPPPPLRARTAADSVIVLSDSD